MKTTTLKLVTIIAEDDIEARLVRDLKELGVKGYTIVNVRGEGLHGARDNAWEGENIRLETLVSSELADKLFEFLHSTYFPRYLMVVYMENVEVIRAEKFL
ncbi:MAG: nitrogen regulatory protein P-II [[Candidatus Thermochlorobacteriaceae] bacterium GBChlB]|nr:MAG: nitrogen regulatory protein P-II [[Candidatus Thermochlorobacteriaceae] bacterium GBChlB]